MFSTDRSPLPESRKRTRLDDSIDETRGKSPGVEERPIETPTQAVPAAEVKQNDPKIPAFRQQPVAPGSEFCQAQMIQQRNEIEGILKNIAPGPRQEVLNNALITLIQMIGSGSVVSIVPVVAHEANMYSASENERLNRFQKLGWRTQGRGSMHRQNVRQDLRSRRFDSFRWRK